MSKSILVIDTPKNCTECPLVVQLHDIHHVCSGNHRQMTIPASKPKPDWCPLKNVPVKQEISALEPVFLRGAKNGYNTCINEILKGVNENEEATSL